MKKRNALLILLFLTCLSCHQKPNSKGINDINIAFKNWQKEKIKKGVDYLSKENCNQEYALNDSLRNSDKPRDWGFPDEINFSYGCLNSDNKIDALITFNPIQCDGGNGSMWIQIQLLALSDKEEYKINESFFDSIGNNLKGFYHLEKIKNKRFSGKYLEFKETDPHCCPSIEKNVFIDFSRKNLIIE